MVLRAIISVLRLLRLISHTHSLPHPVTHLPSRVDPTQGTEVHYGITIQGCQRDLYYITKAALQNSQAATPRNVVLVGWYTTT